MSESLYRNVVNYVLHKPYPSFFFFLKKWINTYLEGQQKSQEEERTPRPDDERRLLLYFRIYFPVATLCWVANKPAFA